MGAWGSQELGEGRVHGDITVDPRGSPHMHSPKSDLKKAAGSGDVVNLCSFPAFNKDFSVDGVLTGGEGAFVGLGVEICTFHSLLL